ncbi:hypothetical protein WJX72_011144 [[Myrmecia] bisecta]|uniref:Uncharacterized protein n=1 Tax=[Myrmecia] bisecta TaxID=41462 RepID=A0AAW1RAG4_9CHLO
MTSQLQGYNTTRDQLALTAFKQRAATAPHLSSQKQRLCAGERNSDTAESGLSLGLQRRPIFGPVVVCRVSRRSTSPTTPAADQCVQAFHSRSS